MGLRTGQGLLKARHSTLAIFTRVSDLVLIGLSLWCALALHNMQWIEKYSLALACAFGLFLFFAQFHDLYRSWRGAPLWQEGVRLWWTWLGVVLGLLFLAYVTKTSAEYSRRIMLTWFLMTPVLLTFFRGVFHLLIGVLRQRGLNTRTVAIVGARDLGVRLAMAMLDAPWMGLRPVGVFDDRARHGGRPLAEGPVPLRGDLDALVAFAREGKVELVYIALPMRAETRIRDLIARLSDTTVSVYIVPDLFMFDLMNAGWSQVGDLPTVGVLDTPFSGLESWVKRFEDLILASLVLLVAAIPMAVIALMVKSTSRGPVLFKQSRYGLRGEPIEVWKFRTMTACENGPSIIQATRHDPRVTPLGRFLRRTSLDELPQFINVLQGTMSIVGPRPHAVAHNEQYRKIIAGYMLRHKVKPGITGWAQVNGWRGETETLDKMKIRVEHDLAYIRNWSLWLDLRIIFFTVYRGFSSKSAY